MIVQYCYKFEFILGCESAKLLPFKKINQGNDCKNADTKAGSRSNSTSRVDNKERIQDSRTKNSCCTCCMLVCYGNKITENYQRHIVERCKQGVVILNLMGKK